MWLRDDGQADDTVRVGAVGAKGRGKWVVSCADVAEVGGHFEA